MMKHFEKDNQVSPTKAAARYTWRHACAIYPYFLLAWLLAFFKQAFESQYSLHEMLSVAKKSIWELLLVWTVAPGTQTLIFVSWYVSAMLISGYFIYWLLKKNREVFVGFITPLTILLAYSFFARNGRGLDYHYSFNQLLGDCAVRSWAGMSLGCISYCLYKKAVSFDFSRKGKVLLSVMEILTVSFVLYGLIRQKHSNYDFFTALLFSPLIVLGFMRRSLLSRMLDRSVFRILGAASIGMYFTQGLLFPCINKIRLDFGLSNKASYALLIFVSTLVGLAAHFAVSQSVNFFRSKESVAFR